MQIIWDKMHTDRVSRGRGGGTLRGLHLPVSTTESKRSSSPPSSPMNGATKESSPMSFLSCKGTARE